MSEYNIKINKGTDFSRSFALSESNTAIDIAGYTFEGTLKERYTSTQSTAFTMSIVDASTGLFQAALSDTTTTSMGPGTWVYDIVMIKPNGDKIRLLEGKAFVKQGVTA